MTQAAQVLDALRVVDLSNTLIGTQMSQLLADFGADVVHVEPPGGSPLRQQAAWPFWGRGRLLGARCRHRAAAGAAGQASGRSGPVDDDIDALDDGAHAVGGHGRVRGP